MRKNLGISLDWTFGSEGGYSKAKTDSGNYLNGVLVGTKYGITGKTLAAHRGVKTVTADDVKNMTRDEAAEIYVKSYWPQSGGDILPDGLDYAAFDFGVNSGPARAVKTLQRVLGIAQDGIVGGQTLAAVNRYPGGVPAVIRAYCDARMVFLRGLGGAQGFSANGRGWTYRVTGIDPRGVYARKPGVVGNALALAKGRATATPAGVPAPAYGPDTIPGGNAKANAANTSLTRLLERPEALMPVAAGLSSVGAVATGEGPFQYALAFGVVVLVLAGLYFFIKRARAEA